MTPPAVAVESVRRRTVRGKTSVDELEEEEALLPKQVRSLDRYDNDDDKYAVVGKEAAVVSTPAPAVQPVNWTFVALLTIAAFASRFYKISAGDFVLWDEAHFGKFASYYLRRMFYFDVHPPLGKMLVALGGYLAGVDGAFEFPSGSKYPEGFNYVFMRMFVASFGTLIVPFTYLTAVQLRLGRHAAYLCAAMALFENGFIGITRLILLDSMLICFTSAAALSYTTFRNQESRPFSVKWWAWMVATGVAIGCVSSVKWVGFLVTGLVGLMTIEELWVMLGDVKMPKLTFIKHFLARVIGLILVPVGLYMLSFYIHFAILNKSGTGDANMSSLFQASLQGSPLQESPLDVVFGSEVTLKSNTFGGGLLHSHVQGYPTGSRQQQVTTYLHKDENNVFQIIRAQDPKNDLERSQFEGVEPIQDGAIIRLRHLKTGRHLHSHVIPAPITPGDYEVSAYGQEGLNDPNDLWELQIVKGPSTSAQNKKALKTLMTSFRLKHVPTGCYLKSRNVQLPEWGFRQGEVTCDRTRSPKGRQYLWNVETNKHAKLEPGKPGLYKSRFLDDFRDCNVGMYLTNNALRPDPELEASPLTSTPLDWIFMSRGIRMANWNDDHLKFFMLGNPAVWPVSTIAILVLLAGLGVSVLIKQRKAFAYLPQPWNYLCYQLKVATGGWALHYLPFFSQGRVLYLHHYYPALLFAILNSGLLFDFCTRRLPDRTQQMALAGCIGIVLGTFLYFSPMAYGITGPAAAFAAGRQWMASWKLSD